MRNAWSIFKGDVRLVATNAIGLMVAIGLVVVPALYAWFNIAGTWDPYENTGGLKVAVANEDVGYTSSLLPTDVNVGKSVVAALHENDQFDWVFVDEGQAVEGVVVAFVHGNEHVETGEVFVENGTGPVREAITPPLGRFAHARVGQVAAVAGVSSR